MNSPGSTQPPAAGQAAPTLTAFIGSTGAAFFSDNDAGHPLAFALSYRNPALSFAGQAFAREILTRYNSHAALIAELEHAAEELSARGELLGVPAEKDGPLAKARQALQAAKEGRS